MTTATLTQQDALTAHLVRDLDLTYEMVLTLMEGFTDETARTAPDGQLPALWYLGHLMCSKDYVAYLYGEDGILTLDGQFYADWSDDCAHVNFTDAPPLDEMLALYKGTHARLRTVVENLTVEDLHRKTEREITAPLDAYWMERLSTLGWALSLVQMHDAYHGGMLAALRQRLDMSVPF
ncbi:DinB family protein [Streptomyces sp. NBC_01304]|uniref:DinB family protein n=1 Tax=Streptomyces sp. NBC_01304 TaxID=2903818 RepID=UPI002E1333FB|nr:DinB family protein [Streptomyces sp. NBC_01304]